MTHTEELSLDGRVILITGASGGIGQVVAKAAAKAGAECILHGRSADSLAPLYDEIVAAGHRQPALFPLDFTKASEAEYARLADGIKKDFGRLDGIVHLAAHFEGLQPIAAQPYDDWRRSFHVNTTAVFAITQACLPLLQDSAPASVLFAADPAASEKAFYGAYAASKSALLTLTKTFALEHAKLGRVRFNAINPGPRLTALRKAAFPADDPQAQPAEDIAELFVYCLSQETHNLNGQLINADGKHQVI